MKGGDWLRTQAAYATKVAQEEIGAVLGWIKPWAAIAAEQRGAARAAARRR
jgi:hypothetical protein